MEASGQREGPAHELPCRQHTILPASDSGREAGACWGEIRHLWGLTCAPPVSQDWSLPMGLTALRPPHLLVAVGLTVVHMFINLLRPQSSNLPVHSGHAGGRGRQPVPVCMEHPRLPRGLAAFSRCGQAAARRQMDGRSRGQTDSHAFDVRATLLISWQKVKPSPVLSPRPSPPGDRVIGASVLRAGLGPHPSQAGS